MSALDAGETAALRAMVAQLNAALGGVVAPAPANDVPSRRMGRTREGSARWRRSRWQARLRLTGGEQSPEYVIAPPTDGTAYDRVYAKGVVRAWQRRYDATGKLPDSTDTPSPSVAVLTVHAYAAEWIKAQTHRTQKDEAAYLERHLAPSALGAKRLDAATRADVIAWVKWLRARSSMRDAKPLAPRYVRTIYDVARRAMEHAVVEGRVPGSPFVGTAKYLPAVEDKHAGERAGWKLARSEAATLLVHPKVPPDRRVLYALALYTGARFGELSALRWSAHDKDAPVLGRITYATAYNRRTKKVEGTKTKATKEVPVHPHLAAILKAWWDAGWAKHQGRAPKRGDLIVPSKLHAERGVYGAGEMFERDLVACGIDVRHFHALRHTFVSLALGAGARGEILKRATHARPKAAFDMYAADDWPALCAEIVKLDLSPTPGAVPPDSIRVDSGTTDGAERESRRNTAVEWRPQPDSKRLSARKPRRKPRLRVVSGPQTALIGDSGTNSGTATVLTYGRVYAAWAKGALWSKGYAGEAAS